MTLKAGREVLYSSGEQRTGVQRLMKWNNLTIQRVGDAILAVYEGIDSMPLAGLLQRQRIDYVEHPAVARVSGQSMLS